MINKAVDLTADTNGAVTEATAPGLCQLQELPLLLMQELVLFIEFAMVWPRAYAATARAEPMIARIIAYSAAEAPERSLSILMNIVIEVPFCISLATPPN